MTLCVKKMDGWLKESVAAYKKEKSELKTRIDESVSRLNYVQMQSDSHISQMNKQIIGEVVESLRKVKL